MIVGGAIKRVLIIILLGLLFGSPALAAGRVVVIQGVRIAPYEDTVNGIEASCNARVKRIVMGENVHLDYVREVKNIKPDLVVAVGPTALSAMLKLRNIPVIYTMVVNADSMDKLPGISGGAVDDGALERLVDTVPHVKHIGVLYDPDESGALVGRLAGVFDKRDVGFVTETVSGADDIPEGVRRLKGKVDLLWMIPDATVMEEDALGALFKSALDHEIPVATFSNRYLSMGAMISLGIRPYEVGKRTGRLARRILDGKGASVGTVDSSGEVMVFLNRRMARKLGVRVNELNDSRYVKIAQGN